MTGIWQEYDRQRILGKYMINYILRFGGTLPLFWFILTLIEQSYNIFYTTHTTRREPLLLSSLHPLGRGPPPGVPSRDRTQACRTASRCATIWATPHPILFYSILFYFILFYFILFYSILFSSILVYSILASSMQYIPGFMRGISSLSEGVYLTNDVGL